MNLGRLESAELFVNLAPNTVRDRPFLTELHIHLFGSCIGVIIKPVSETWPRDTFSKIIIIKKTNVWGYKVRDTPEQASTVEHF